MSVGFFQRLRRRRRPGSAAAGDHPVPADGGRPEGREGIGAARYVVHLSGNYRPRLEEVVCELKRRISSAADLIVLEGAERATRYTSAEMQNYAYKPALSRCQAAWRGMPSSFR